MFSMTKERAESLVRSITTSLSIATGGSDYRRWRSPDSFSKDWDSRSSIIASLVPPDSAVIEFGAGRMALKDLLPSGCAYTPSDLIDRGGGTLVCDLNSKMLPPIPRHDVAVFGGVLEYVHDVPRLISHLSNSVEIIVASYAVTDSNQENRRGNGWVNDLSSSDILALFEAAGFRMDCEDHWGTQSIYRFRRQLQHRPQCRSR